MLRTPSGLLLGIWNYVRRYMDEDTVRMISPESPSSSQQKQSFCPDSPHSGIPISCFPFSGKKGVKVLWESHTHTQCYTGQQLEDSADIRSSTREMKVILTIVLSYKKAVSLPSLNTSSSFSLQPCASKRQQETWWNGRAGRWEEGKETTWWD